MRTLVIGDIHGCINTFNNLLDRVNYSNDDRLILLGDYIDRGKHSFEVIKKIQELQSNNSNVYAIRGNHEDMLLNWYFSEFQYDKENNWDIWKSNGAIETVKSFRFNKSTIDDVIDWIVDLPVYVEGKKNIFVHAGIGKEDNLNEMSEYDFIWSRKFYSGNKIGKNVVFGHTPVENPIFDLDYKLIGIDTGCVFGFRLTCAIFDDDENFVRFEFENCVDEKFEVKERV